MDLIIKIEGAFKKVSKRTRRVLSNLELVVMEAQMLEGELEND